jgi:hypothetical protein
MYLFSHLHIVNTPPSAGARAEVHLAQERMKIDKRGNGPVFFLCTLQILGRAVHAEAQDLDIGKQRQPADGSCPDRA